MANIKELKKKIKSTKGTLKITSAMKLVSAAKLNRAQIAISNSRPYSNELEDMIKTISALVTDDYSHPFLTQTDSDKALVLVFSSNKGLCGGFNSQLTKEIKKFTANSNMDLKFSFIGKKVKELLEKEVSTEKYYQFDTNSLKYSHMETVAEELSELYKTGEYGRIYIAYNVFETVLSFLPTVKQVLPMTLDESEKEELTKKFPFDFKYEPNPKAILDSLIPETFISSVYTCLLDAEASEHGSRMTAMDSAVTNCKEAIRTLTIKTNKLRQAAITTELIEVVSGAESLNG